jgi:serine/threonine protein kinase
MTLTERLVSLRTHSDIKSSNLLVADSHHTEVKVGDFGFATVKQDIGTQTRCGTPSWTAPEIISGDPYTEKADIYRSGTKPQPLDLYSSF